MLLLNARSCRVPADVPTYGGSLVPITESEVRRRIRIALRKVLAQAPHLGEQSQVEVENVIRTALLEEGLYFKSKEDESPGNGIVLWYRTGKERRVVLFRVSLSGAFYLNDSEHVSRSRFEISIAEPENMPLA